MNTTSPPMYDCHTHTFLSDGALGPSELARRAEEKNVSGIAFTDHVDAATVHHLVPAIARHIEDLREHIEIDLRAGCEITHTHPNKIREVVKQARNLGAEVVVVHGESPVEPVLEGTNRAAVRCPDVDILAHPGFIQKEDVLRAVENQVALEISGRKGHSLTNGWLVNQSRETEAVLVMNTDAHAPGDLMNASQAMDVIRGAGHGSPRTVLENNRSLFENAGS